MSSPGKTHGVEPAMRTVYSLVSASLADLGGFRVLAPRVVCEAPHPLPGDRLGWSLVGAAAGGGGGGAPKRKEADGSA